MALTSETFAENAKWLALQRNRFSWPKHWQILIFKIHREQNVLDDTSRYIVLPTNPEWPQYLDECDRLESARAVRGFTALQPFPVPPPMHLDPIEFDSMEDIDRWAFVANRLR